MVHRTRKYVPDHADYTAPTWQHELLVDTDHAYIRLDHEVRIADLSDVWSKAFVNNRIVGRLIDCHPAYSYRTSNKKELLASYSDRFRAS